MKKTGLLDLASVGDFLGDPAELSQQTLQAVIG